MRRYSGEIELQYFPPEILETLATSSALKWEEMIQDIELGPKELHVFMRWARGAGLTKKQSLALSMYYFHEIPTVEIASKLGIARQNVDKLLARGKARLRKYLKSKGVHFTNK